MANEKTGVLEKIGWERVNTDVCINLGIESLAFLIEPISQVNPVLGSIMVLAVASHIVFSTYQQSKLAKASDHFTRNFEIFKEEVIRKKEFQDFFINWYPEYLKMRGEEKLDFALNIMDNIAVTNAEEMQLERIMNTLLMISVESLNEFRTDWQRFLDEDRVDKSGKVKMGGVGGEERFLTELSSLGLITPKTEEERQLALDGTPPQYETIIAYDYSSYAEDFGDYVFSRM